jgi:uncharacterized protein
MKYLLVLAVVLVAFWIWRNNRQVDPPRNTPARRDPGIPLPMIACSHCGTHLPEAEAVRGEAGSYCCREHLRQHEASAR